MINFYKETPKFELVVHVRDGKGNPTGKRKTFLADDGNKLHDYWVRHNGVQKKQKRKKIKNEKLPNAKQAEKILKEIFDKNAD